MLKEPCEAARYLASGVQQWAKESKLDATASELLDLKIKNPEEFEWRFENGYKNALQGIASALHRIESPPLNALGRWISRYSGAGPGDPEFRRELDNYKELKAEHDGFMSRLEHISNTLPIEEQVRLFTALHYRARLGEADPLREMKDEIEKRFERYGTTFIESGILTPETVGEFQREGRGYVPFTYPQQREEMVRAWAGRFFGKAKEIAEARAAAPEKDRSGQRMRFQVPGLGMVGRHVLAAKGRFEQRQIRDLRRAMELGLDMTARPILAGLAQEGKAATALTLLNRVAKHPEWVRDGATDGPVPAGFIEVRGREFGPLDGKWVRRDLVGYLVDVARPDQTGLMGALVATNALFKKWAVLGRLSALWNGNVFGNIFMSRMLTPFSSMPSAMTEAWRQLKEYRETRKAPAELKELIDGGRYQHISRFMAELGETQGPTLASVEGTGRDYLTKFASRFLDMLEYESTRTPDGTVSLAGYIRALGNAIGHLDISLGYAAKATGREGMRLGGQGLEELWTWSDNFFKLANYIHLRKNGSSDLFFRKAREARGLPPGTGYSKELAARMIDDFWDVRDVAPWIRTLRQAPLVGWSFVTYPYLSYRNLFGKGYAARNPLGTFFWMWPGALMTAGYMAITGKSYEEVEEDRMLAAGGNRSLSEMLTPMYVDGDGRAWHLNLGAAGAADLLKSMADPSGRLVESGPGNKYARWLMSANPMMSNLAQLGGYSPYSGRPATNYRWWHFFTAATPATGVMDILRREQLAEDDAEKGRAPLRTGTERAFQAAGVHLRTAGPKGSATRARQKEKARYQEKAQEFTEEGGEFGIVPRKPAKDEDLDLLRAYSKLTEK